MQFISRFCLIFLSFCFVNAARGQLISFAVKNESLEKVFLLIEQQSDYNFIYTAEQISKASPVTLTVKEEPIASVLNKCFLSQALQYAIDRKHILVKEKQVKRRFRWLKRRFGLLPHPPAEILGFFAAYYHFFIQCRIERYF